MTSTELLVDRLIEAVETARAHPTLNLDEELVQPARAAVIAAVSPSASGPDGNIITFAAALWADMLDRCLLDTLTETDLREALARVWYAGLFSTAERPAVRDDVQCRCVGSQGPNLECGACGGSGCITAEVPTPDGVIKERGQDEEAERALRDGLSQVEPASGLNPADFDPSRICPNPALYDTGNCCGGACSNGEHDGYLVDLGYPARVDARIVEFMNDPDAGLTHEQIATEIGDLAKGGTNITGTVLGALNRAYQRGLEYPSRKPTVLAEDVFQKLEAYRKSRVRFGATSDEATSARVEVYNLAERCRYALDCARDQRAEREDAQRPRPEAASPVRAAEAPASLSQVNPPPEDAVSQPRREGDWALTIARSLMGGTEHAVAEALRHADACGYMRGHEAGAKAKPHPNPTTGGEAPGRDDRDLFDRLHIKSMTREWFADSLPPTLDGYLAVLRRRLTRAASL